MWSYIEPVRLLALFVIVVVVSVIYQLFLVVHARRLDRPAPKGTQELPQAPGHLPIIGVPPTILLGLDKFLGKLRDSAHTGLSSLYCLGFKHIVILSPTVTARIFGVPKTAWDRDNILWFFLNVVGGTASKYDHMVMPAINSHGYEQTFNLLMREPSLGKMVNILCRNLEREMPNFVSFADRPIDQLKWEQQADVKRTVHDDGSLSVEAGLMPLVIDFVSSAATPSIFGSDLIRNYPNIVQDLWAFNDGFFWLAAYLPRWLPIPILQRAYAGRQRVFDALCDQQVALDKQAAGEDPGPQWANLDDISEFIKVRNEFYRERKLPLEARLDLGMFWALQANSNFAVFWLLMRILSTPGLLQELRQELEPYVRVSTVPTGFGTREPKIQFDEQVLLRRCPLLKSSFIECMRLDTEMWSIRRLEKDVSIMGDAPRTFHGDHKSATGEAPRYHLGAGSLVEIPMNLQFMDPQLFDSPETFRPDRHIRPSEQDGKPVAHWGAVRAFGGGASACKGRMYGEKEVLACVAGLIMLWEFEPVDGQWKLPKRGKASGVVMPKEVTRVRIRKRELA